MVKIYGEDTERKKIKRDHGSVKLKFILFFKPCAKKRAFAKRQTPLPSAKKLMMGYCGVQRG